MATAITLGEGAAALAGGKGAGTAAIGQAENLSAKEALSTLKAGDAGAYGALRGRSMPGDMLTPHHMPQAAMKFTDRNAGGALALPHSEHVQTRTFGGRGIATLREEQGMDFRSVLARDIRDIRGHFGPKYDQGIRNLLQYYKQNFPELMTK